MRALVVLGALTIFAGTAATAAGPHAGGSPGQKINRLALTEGHDGLRDPSPREIALVFSPRRRRGLVRSPAAVGRGGAAAPAHRDLLAAPLQGAVGLDQYETIPGGARLGPRRARLGPAWIATLGRLRRRRGYGRLGARARRPSRRRPLDRAPLEFPGN